MSLDYYDVRGKHWVSPRLILVYYDQLLKIFGEDLFNHREFKKVIEAKIVAIVLLGIHKATKTHFMMQVPVEVNRSPDIVTMNLREYSDKPVQMEIQDVEVVDYGENSNEDIATFLINKKLSVTKAKKAYDNKTIIICNVSKAQIAISAIDLHQKIKALNPEPHVCIIGAIPNLKSYYRLVRIWPEIDSKVEFNIIEEGNNYPVPDACKFSLGTNKQIMYSKNGEPLPTPYEVFELAEQKIKAKFLSKGSIDD